MVRIPLFRCHYTFEFHAGLDLGPVRRDLTRLLDAVWELPLEGDLEKLGTGRLGVSHFWQTRHFKLDAAKKELAYTTKTIDLTKVTTTSAP